MVADLDRPAVSADWGDNDSLRPVFIMGCQRSGTTMLASHLANGRNAFALPELIFSYRFVLERPDGPEAMRRAYEAFTGHFRFRAIATPYPFADFARAMASADRREAVLGFVRVYLAAHGVALDPARPAYWFEHSPNNRDWFHVMSGLFPAARFVHIVRDPRPVYLSMRDNPRFVESDPFSASVMWKDAVAKGRLFALKHPERVIELRYEDFLADPERHLRAIADFVGLPFGPELLAGGGVRLPAFTRRQHALTAGGADRRKIDDWRAKISAEEDRILCSLCSDWMLEYRYLDAPEMSRPRIGAKLRHQGLGIWRRLKGKAVTTITDLSTPRVRGG